MICTVAAIAFFLGAMPPRGTTVVVPRSRIFGYSERQLTRARDCARKYGIQWRIDEEK